MIFYQDQETSKQYNAEQLKKAKRLSDHIAEPSWGVYNIDGATAVICDCDVTHAEDTA
jgi:hypothetical protein